VERVDVAEAAESETREIIARILMTGAVPNTRWLQEHCAGRQRVRTNRIGPACRGPGAGTVAHQGSASVRDHWPGSFAVSDVAAAARALAAAWAKDRRA